MRLIGNFAETVSWKLSLNCHSLFHCQLKKLFWNKLIFIIIKFYDCFGKKSNFFSNCNNLFKQLLDTQKNFGRVSKICSF